ncbi:hypothetical protein [Okeania sp. SIO3I5]|uniref:hypothetical protein n=1 Tax=Okeania sp. SIO3I5 TaxID=2607805 RepID=UPI0025CF42CE|nr:hypothetical protein [Okeania sp. SIO3I5]
MNTFDNKQHSCLQSELKTNYNKSNYDRLKKITHKRNCRVENYPHIASKKVINWCVNQETGILILIIGQNQNWKQEIKLGLGKKKNQQFVNIPDYWLIEMLRYQAKLKGIKVLITEESYRYQSRFFRWG